MRLFFLILAVIFYVIGVFIKWYMTSSNMHPEKTSMFEAKNPFLSSILPWNIPFGIWFMIAICLGLSKYFD